MILVPHRDEFSIIGYSIENAFAIAHRHSDNINKQMEQSGRHGSRGCGQGQWLFCSSAAHAQAAVLDR
jgi:hypothetical protein